jgi:hypothetical protein
MKKIIVAIILGFVLGLSACTYVTSGGPPRTDVTGGVWYVKSTYIPFFLLLPITNSIYYCPPTTGGGTPKCIEAEIE